MAAIKPIFRKRASIRSRLLVLCLAAVLLLVVDQQYPWFAPVRGLLSTVTVPVFWLAGLPWSFAEWGAEGMVSRESLLEENRKLDSENRLLRARLQKLVSLSAENHRLRNLLSSTTKIDEEVLVAEIIGVNPDPNLRTVLIDKGVSAGVYVGQAVIDAAGLVGQVIEVNALASRVLLITDSSHAVPVRVNRNGVRSIAEGLGVVDELQLVHVASTVDIRQDDLLVSSGMGRRFPEGYPVGTVADVHHDPGHPFLTVRVLPSARLDRIRHVLLVFGGERSPAGEIP